MRKSAKLFLISFLSVIGIATIISVPAVVLTTNKQPDINNNNVSHEIQEVMIINNIYEINETKIKEFLDAHLEIKHEYTVQNHEIDSSKGIIKVLLKLENGWTLDITIPYKEINMPPVNPPKDEYKILINAPINPNGQEKGLLQENINIKSQLILNNQVINNTNNFYYEWKINSTLQANQNSATLNGVLFNKFGQYQIEVFVYSNSTKNELLANNSLVVEINKSHIDTKIENDLDINLSNVINNNFQKLPNLFDDENQVISETIKNLNEEFKKYSDYKFTINQNPTLDQNKKIVNVQYSIQAKKYTYEDVSSTHNLQFKYEIKTPVILDKYEIEFNPIVADDKSEPNALLDQLLTISINIKKNGQSINGQFGYIWNVYDKDHTDNVPHFKAVFSKFGDYKINVQVYEDTTYTKLLATNSMTININENHIKESIKKDLVQVNNLFMSKLNTNTPIFNDRNLNNDMIDIIIQETMRSIGGKYSHLYWLHLNDKPIIDKTNETITLNYKFQATQYSHEFVYSQNYSFTFKYKIINQSTYKLEISDVSSDLKDEQDKIFHENVLISASLFENNYSIPNPTNAGFRFEWIINGETQQTNTHELQGELFKKFGTYNITLNMRFGNEPTILATNTKTIIVDESHMSSKIKNNLDTFPVEMYYTLLAEKPAFNKNDLTEDQIKNELQKTFNNIRPNDQYKMLFLTTPIIDCSKQTISIDIKFQALQYMPDQEVYSNVNTLTFQYDLI